MFAHLERIISASESHVAMSSNFQVETIGDCYIAVAGLPDPRPDHAVAMARFSRECLVKMKVLTKQLETTLGPDNVAYRIVQRPQYPATHLISILNASSVLTSIADTGELSLRLGLYSGPKYRRTATAFGCEM